MAALPDALDTGRTVPAVTGSGTRVRAAGRTGLRAARLTLLALRGRYKTEPGKEKPF